MSKSMSIVTTVRRLRQKKIAKITCVLLFVSVLLLGTQKKAEDQEVLNESTSVGRLTSLHPHVYEVSAGEGVKPIFNSEVEDDVGSWDDTKYLSQPEEIIPMKHRKPDNEIRYAAFGSSCSWGSRLHDRDKEAYVWRLSDLDHERGRNFAIRANGPAYPASCVSSMIGEEEFDVIILEFLMRADEGLLHLAKRLRQRFPNAIIVMTSLWNTFTIVNKKKKGTVVEWAAEHDVTDKGFVHDPKFHELFLREGETEEDEWYHRAIPVMQVWKETAHEIGAYTYRLPGDTHHGGGEYGWLKMGDKFLAQDSFHLSAGGHEDIATKVKKIVDRVGVPKKRVVGQFADHDQCSNWFQSGEIDPSIKYAPNVSFGKMPNTEKFALSFEQYGEEDGGNWIELENTSDQDMDLSISYMTTGPAPSKYPEVIATRGNGETYVLETKCPLDVGDSKIHVSKLQKFGTIAGGVKARITFKPLSTTEWPFRVVAAMLTPPDLLNNVAIY